MSDKENYKNLKVFFRNEYHSLKAYAQSRIDDTAHRDAEDIVQDVALKLFVRADNPTPIDNIAGFVYSSIRNKIIDLMRRKKKEPGLEADMENRWTEFSEPFPDQHDTVYSEEMKVGLKEAVARLKPLYRDVVIAIDFEGYNFRELSEETGIPKGTLMSRRHRALSILFNELETKKEYTN